MQVLSKCSVLTECDALGQSVLHLRNSSTVLLRCSYFFHLFSIGFPFEFKKGENVKKKQKTGH